MGIIYFWNTSVDPHPRDNSCLYDNNDNDNNFNDNDNNNNKSNKSNSLQSHELNITEPVALGDNVVMDSFKPWPGRYLSGFDYQNSYTETVQQCVSECLLAGSYCISINHSSVTGNCS